MFKNKWFMSVWGLSLFHWLQCLFHYSVSSTIICLQIFSEAPQDSKSLSLILRQRFILPRWYPPSASSWIDLICIGNKKELKIIIAYSFHISNLGSYIFTGLLSKSEINTFKCELKQKFIALESGNLLISESH